MTNDLRLQALAALAEKAPRVFDVIVTEDMGFECSILTDKGIIFRYLGCYWNLVKVIGRSMMR